MISAFGYTAVIHYNLDGSITTLFTGLKQRKY